MAIQFKVPSIACDVCAKTITNAIQAEQPTAKVSVDVASKIVTVETEATKGEIKEAITTAGHTVQ